MRTSARRQMSTTKPPAANDAATNTCQSEGFCAVTAMMTTQLARRPITTQVVRLVRVGLGARCCVVTLLDD